MHLSISIAILLVGTFHCIASGLDSPYAGYIAECKGTGITIKTQGPKGSKLVYLPAKNAAYWRVRLGDQIKCDKDSRVQLFLRWGAELRMTSTNWSKVPLQASPTTENASIAKLVIELDELLGEVAGAKRDSSDSVPVLFRPGPGSRFRLRGDGALLLAWNHQLTGSRLEIGVYLPDGQLLAKTNLDARARSVTIREVKTVLPANHNSDTLRIKIVIRDETTKKFASEAEMISEKEEDQVSKELVDANRQLVGGILPSRIATAAVLLRHHLLNEVSDVVWATINENNMELLNSAELLVLARSLANSVGDLKRAGEVSSRVDLMLEKLDL